MSCTVRTRRKDEREKQTFAQEGPQQHHANEKRRRNAHSLLLPQSRFDALPLPCLPYLSHTLFSFPLNNTTPFLRRKWEVKLQTPYESIVCKPPPFSFLPSHLSHPPPLQFSFWNRLLLLSCPAMKKHTPEGVSFLFPFLHWLIDCVWCFFPLASKQKAKKTHTHSVAAHWKISHVYMLCPPPPRLV